MANRNHSGRKSPNRPSAGGAPGRGRSLLGVAPPAAPGKAAGNGDAVGAPPGPQTKGAQGVRIQVDLVLGCITTEQAPVVVVGRYRGSPCSGALAKFDKALGDWITGAIELNMIGSGLGEIFLVPMERRGVGPRNLLIAGMGEFGRFSAGDLRLLMTNVTYAIKTLGHDEFSALLIGSGEGALTRDLALSELLGGVSDGLKRLPRPDEQFITLSLVENREATWNRLSDSLQRLGKDGGLGRLRVSRRQSESWKPERRSTEAPSEEHYPSDRGPRITVGYESPPVADGSAVLRYSALAESAVVPVREKAVQTFLVDELAGLLASPVRSGDKDAIRAEQERHGQALATYLIHEDFQWLLRGTGPLTLILDPSAAHIPWEMGAFEKNGVIRLLGTDLMLTRQFRTRLSKAPGIAPPINEHLKVLVIADPAPEGEGLSLAGARREGLAVVKALDDVQALKPGLNLEVHVRIGADQDAPLPGAPDPLLDQVRPFQRVVREPGNVRRCHPAEILSLILTERFDVIHYAGHGTFDLEKPVRRGWVFGRDRILSASEIFQIPQVPRLVFSNACHSSEVDGREGRTAGPVSLDELRRRAGLAEAFFERGVENYLGAGWEVDDDPACVFAQTFYSQALLYDLAPPATLGDSLKRAREAILDRGANWGAYQHYGQANAKLVNVENMPG